MPGRHRREEGKPCGHKRPRMANGVIIGYTICNKAKGHWPWTPHD